MESTRIVLKERPDGQPTAANFESRTVTLPDLEEGAVRVRVSHISIDAFIRTTLDAVSFHGSVGIEAPVTALGVGEIIESNSSALAVGDWVTGPVMAQNIAQMPAEVYQKIDVSDNLPPQSYVGILGVTTGLTAWAGMVEVAKVAEGETVVVSGAAGAVGSVAGQVAKLRGARVIGIAGGPEKGKYLTETLGFDAAVDYKAGDVGEQLDALAPDGINVYFDNVGGEILDTVLDRIAVGARIAICGAVSQYNHLDDVRGPKLYLRLAERNSQMLGFTVTHHAHCFEAAGAQLATWMNSGELTLPEHVIDGIDQFPEALVTLLTGGHMGKLLVAP